jgi:GT2 family glycosyltransferase
VYQGERFLAETLDAVRAQTFSDFEVLISFDGPDAGCEEICARYLDDPRFRLSARPQRLGWAQHISWLHQQVDTEYFYFQQQDDLPAPTYLEALIAHADRHPEAALVHCDLVPFGRITEEFAPVPSVLGSSAFARQMAMLHEQLAAFAFRGLARRDALRVAGGLVTNDCDDYGVDTTWLSSMALAGELHRVPLPLYRKRYHDRNTESRWWRWPRARRVEAWSCHCVDMMNVALRVEVGTNQRRLLWLAAAARLTNEHLASPFFPDGPLSASESASAFESFLRRAEASAEHAIPALLGAEWPAIRAWTAAVVAATRPR